MIWDNKAARIQDITQAGQPGYDRNGFKSELVGQSTHRGIEVEFSTRLDKITKIKDRDSITRALLQKIPDIATYLQKY